MKSFVWFGRSLALAVNLQGSHWVFFLRLDKGRAAETYLGTQGFSASSTSDTSDLMLLLNVSGQHC